MLLEVVLFQVEAPTPLGERIALAIKVPVLPGNGHELHKRIALGNQSPTSAFLLAVEGHPVINEFAQLVNLSGKLQRRLLQQFPPQKMRIQVGEMVVSRKPGIVRCQ